METRWLLLWQAREARMTCGAGLDGLEGQAGKTPTCQKSSSSGGGLTSRAGFEAGWPVGQPSSWPAPFVPTAADRPPADPPPAPPFAPPRPPATLRKKPVTDCATAAHAGRGPGAEAAGAAGAAGRFVAACSSSRPPAAPQPLAAAPFPWRPKGANSAKARAASSVARWASSGKLRAGMGSGGASSTLSRRVDRRPAGDCVPEARRTERARRVWAAMAAMRRREASREAWRGGSWRWRRTRVAGI